MINNLEIISVNYNTPDLINKLIKSVREIEGDYPIRIIDGSDKEPFKTEIQEVCAKHDNVILEQQGWNIHHGRGMDLAVSTSKHDWVLTLDSEKEIKKPVIEAMYNGCVNNDKVICGSYCYVNSNGGNGKDGKKSPQHQIKYYHPSFCLWKKEFYLEIQSKGVKFVHHGAPNIAIMKYLHNNGLSDVLGIDVADVLKVEKSELDDYFNLKGRGTVRRFGYNI